MNCFPFYIVLCLILFSSCRGKNQQQDVSRNTEQLSLTDSIIRTTSEEDSGKEMLIGENEMKIIKPAIDKWLKYYQIDIKDFVFDKERKLNLLQLRTDTAYPYYGKFEERDDIYNPVLYDYSPDKTKYVDLLTTTGVDIDEDGKYYFRGSDDCQQLGLYDRKEKTYVMFSFRGIHEFANAVFWIDNNTFILTGYCTIEYPVGWYMLEIYDLREDVCRSYILKKEYDEEESYSIAEMKARGIIIN